MRINSLTILLVSAVIAASSNAQGDDKKVAPPEKLIASQYWTWYTPGSEAPMWKGVSDYGKPLSGWYNSNDPLVAKQHIDAMLGNGINVLSYGYFNKASDKTSWHADIIDPDQAFRNGVMKAPNFSQIKFFVSYDLATRAMLVHNAENGKQYGHPNGLDVLPWVHFDDPGMRSADEYPSFNFNAQDQNGFYIYDELIEHDFKNFAENYFNQPNYLKINGQHVVFIYNSWRFNNGGYGKATDGFARAFKRIRTNVFNWYGYKLYLGGDFVSYHNRNNATNYRTQGFFEHYDAVHGWNIYDDHYRDVFGNWSSLWTHTDVSKTVQDNYRSQARLATRVYRNSLPEPAKSAYGSATAKVDYVPLLSFSFRRHSGSDGFKSYANDTNQVGRELNMVKTQRNLSVLAEANATLVYHVAFNQWNEGQLIEPTVLDQSNPFPGRAGWTYLGMIKGILGPGW